MGTCEFSQTCVFFNAEIGYSPELIRQMRAKYCMQSNIGCARLLARSNMPAEKIPDDLLPTDADRLDEVLDDYARLRAYEQDEA